MRGEFEADAADCFGQFLAALRVVAPGPIRAWGCASLRRPSTPRRSAIAAEKLYLQTLLALGWAALAWRFLSADRRRRYLGQALSDLGGRDEP